MSEDFFNKIAGDAYQTILLNRHKVVDYDPVTSSLLERIPAREETIKEFQRTFPGLTVNTPVEKK